MRFAQFKQYDPSFMSRVLEEWHTYYRYKEGVSETDSDAVVRARVAKNYSGWLYELRRRVDRAIQFEPGTTIRDHQPEHILDATWDAMCTYWDGDDFKKRSEKIKQNRSQLRIVHTIRSQSFDEVKKVMDGELG